MNWEQRMLWRWGSLTFIGAGMSVALALIL
jgi:hypothetical protein